MGTRSLSSVKAGGIYHTQYTQFDGYLGGKGADFTKAVIGMWMYLSSLKCEKRGGKALAAKAKEVGKAYLWGESLLTGHGYRIPDEDGKVWSYREGKEIDPEQMAGWIEYIRIADFDKGELSFYESDLNSHILTLKMDDLLALDHDGPEVLYKLFELADQTRGDGGDSAMDLNVQTGKRCPVEFGWAKKGDLRDYATMTFNGKIIYASSFSPKEQKEAAVKNLEAVLGKVGV